MSYKSSKYALKKARTLIAAEFRASGEEGLAKQYEYEPGFTTSPLRAFAKYIESMERANGTARNIVK